MDQQTTLPHDNMKRLKRSAFFARQISTASSQPRPGRLPAEERAVRVGFWQSVKIRGCIQAQYTLRI